MEQPLQGQAMPQNNPAASIKKPWQTIVLLVFQYIGLVFMGLALILGLVAGNLLSSMTTVEGAGVLAAGIGGAFSIILLPFLVLAIFIVIGLHKGQKWSPILIAAFSALSLLMSLNDINALSIIFQGFFIYLAVVSAKHPFFNQAKK